MAKYEKEGFCPSNEFSRYCLDNGKTVDRERIIELLGDRINYMVYDHKD